MELFNQSKYHPNHPLTVSIPAPPAQTEISRPLTPRYYHSAEKTLPLPDCKRLPCPLRPRPNPPQLVRIRLLQGQTEMLNPQNHRCYCYVKKFSGRRIVNACCCNLYVGNCKDFTL